MNNISNSGYIQFNPDLIDTYDMEHKEEIYTPSNYPFCIPDIYVEGFCELEYPQMILGGNEDSVIVVRNNILTKYTTIDYAEMLYEDESGNTLWIDERIGPEEEQKITKYLGYLRNTKEHRIERYNLENLQKETYKVTLDSSGQMDIEDFNRLADYIDPNIIKRIPTENTATTSY